jgi:hypothetical protein
LQLQSISIWAVTPLVWIHVSWDKRLPMGIAGSLDIFQGKMSELMESLEYKQAYLDELLCISRNRFEDHLEKLEEIFRRLHDVRLKATLKNQHFAYLQ